MTAAQLQAVGLAVGYPGRTVGRGFDFALHAGEVLALLGPNGSGKTTLMKTLLGLLAPHAGSVRIGGQDMARMPVRERARQLAYVPQGHASPFAFRIDEVVLMGRTAHAGLFAAPSRADRAAVQAALERVGIAHLAHQPITQVSGGERQLALVARALAQEPRAIVLDEPTASLDFGNQGTVLRELRRLAADGLAVLFSTHDPNQAARHADRALLVRDGGTLALGPVAEVLTRAGLEALYGAPVDEVVAASGPRAFLPA